MLIITGSSIKAVRFSLNRTEVKELRHVKSAQQIKSQQEGDKLLSKKELDEQEIFLSPFLTKLVAPL